MQSILEPPCRSECTSHTEYTPTNLHPHYTSTRDQVAHYYEAPPKNGPKLRCGEDTLPRSFLQPRLDQPNRVKPRTAAVVRRCTMSCGVQRSAGNRPPVQTMETRVMHDLQHTGPQDTTVVGEEQARGSVKSDREAHTHPVRMPMDAMTMADRPRTIGIGRKVSLELGPEASTVVDGILPGVLAARRMAVTMAPAHAWTIWQPSPTTDGRWPPLRATAIAPPRPRFLTSFGTS